MLKPLIVLSLVLASSLAWGSDESALETSPDFCGRVQSLVYQKHQGEEVGGQFVVSSKFDRRSVHIHDIDLTHDLVAKVLDATNEPVEQMQKPNFYKLVARVANFVKVHMCFTGLVIREKHVQGAVIEAGYVDENATIEITVLDQNDQLEEVIVL